MAVLLAPGDHDDAAVLLARAHAGRCLRCAEVLEDDGAADRVLEQLQSRRPARGHRGPGLLAVVAIAQLAVAMPWLFGFNVLSSIGGRSPPRT